MGQNMNILLEIFYVIIGLYMTATMVFTLKDKNHKTRLGTALFWGIIAAIFIFVNTFYNSCFYRVLMYISQNC